MRTIFSRDGDFDSFFETLLQRGKSDLKSVQNVVDDAIYRIKSRGEEALFEDVARFEGWKPSSLYDLLIKEEEMERAYESIDEKVKESLHKAYERINSFHSKQMPKSWFSYEDNGTILGQKVTPVDRAGLYIPGGKAAYPSSLLMNAIPALVAGVKEIAVFTPTPNNEPNQLLLAACKICNLKEVYKAGGATAIAALAYGAGDIKSVDVITGPGNIYVACAKKSVYGDVNIDMIAGPSEIGILADSSANPRLLAIDLLSQAEHDEMASSILITDSEDIANRTLEHLNKELSLLKREKIARESIEKRGAIIIAKDKEEMVWLMNKIAPEHLEVCMREPFSFLPKIKNAGAIFLGHFTPEALGDYMAGPNHTLPTGGSARFYSPLSTEHFLKRSSIVAFSQEGLLEVAKACETIADVEGLEAHRKSVSYRKEI